MRARSLRAPLLLLIIFSLFMPSFWMIDIMQAQGALRDPDPTQLTLRFDESRSKQETLEDADVDALLEQAAFAPVDEIDEPDGVMTVLAPAFGPGSAIAALEVRLPALTAGELHRITRCVLPPDPFREVPTTPPLIAA